MLKYPPLSLSRRRQKMEGESKSGLRNVSTSFYFTVMKISKLSLVFV